MWKKTSLWYQQVLSVVSSVFWTCVDFAHALKSPPPTTVWPSRVLKRFPMRDKGHEKAWRSGNRNEELAHFWQTCAFKLGTNTSEEPRRTSSPRLLLSSTHANRFSSTAVDEKDRTMHFPVLPNARARVYHVNLSQGFAECEDAKCWDSRNI